MDRLYRLLMGAEKGPEGRVPAAMLTVAIGGAVMHPLVTDLDASRIAASSPGLLTVTL